MIFMDKINETGNMLIYAVGDIHGCFVELRELYAKMEADRNGAKAKYVFLGDYIDRGPSSAQVVQFLIDARRENTEVEFVFLRGNHEQMMLDFEDDKPSGQYWLYNGGQETLKSYTTAKYDHNTFYRSLQWLYRFGDVVFVHANIDPNVDDLNYQTNSVLIWDREFSFYDGIYEGGYFVVHGHTPLPNGPWIGANQINVDTGCVFGQKHSEQYGALTAVKIESKNDFANDGTLKFTFLSVRQTY